MSSKTALLHKLNRIPLFFPLLVGLAAAVAGLAAVALAHLVVSVLGGWAVFPVAGLMMAAVLLLLHRGETAPAAPVAAFTLERNFNSGDADLDALLDTVYVVAQGHGSHDLGMMFLDELDTVVNRLKRAPAAADSMKLVLIESPYAGDVDANLAYLRAAMRDCLMRGEAPFASHALYTQAGVLDDTLPAERALGIEAGLCWGARAAKTVVYQDRGLSVGMQYGIDRARMERRDVEYRSIHAPASETSEKADSAA
ncbi:hypothetical protein [Burkholderia ambifaria]|uniref:DUF7768 domain-containing protein n=1 Tax=Burkholderia ambifaria TaxID=152480 RepID=UPI001F49BD6B|nr:hypothetical protein [Burkholderia ambifaria]